MKFAKLTLFDRTASAAQPVFNFPVRVTYSGTLRIPYTPFSRSMRLENRKQIYVASGRKCRNVEIFVRRSRLEDAGAAANGQQFARDC